MPLDEVVDGEQCPKAEHAVVEGRQDKQYYDGQYADNGKGAETCTDKLIDSKQKQEKE